MARLPRFNLPGYPQHVIVRGNNRQAIFYGNEYYAFYLRKLDKAIEQFPCQLHAYVLMTNHVHLLITPMENNALSKAMQSIGRVYVQQFNYLNNRSGTLWEGRYKATLIESNQYLLACQRYIELNPVRADMVEHPAEYPWSSYRRNALGDENTLITPHSLYQSLGNTDVVRYRQYQGLFDNEIPKRKMNKIREMTNKSWVLGDERFKAEIAAKIDRQVEPKSKGGDRRSDDYKKATSIVSGPIDNSIAI